MYNVTGMKSLGAVFMSLSATYLANVDQRWHRWDEGGSLFRFGPPNVFSIFTSQCFFYVAPSLLHSQYQTHTLGWALKMQDWSLIVMKSRIWKTWHSMLFYGLSPLLPTASAKNREFLLNDKCCHQECTRWKCVGRTCMCANISSGSTYCGHHTRKLNWKKKWVLEELGDICVQISHCLDSRILHNEELEKNLKWPGIKPWGGGRRHLESFPDEQLSCIKTNTFGNFDEICTFGNLDK